MVSYASYPTEVSLVTRNYHYTAQSSEDLHNNHIGPVIFLVRPTAFRLSLFLRTRAALYIKSAHNIVLNATQAAIIRVALNILEHSSQTLATFAFFLFLCLVAVIFVAVIIVAFL